MQLQRDGDANAEMRTACSSRLLGALLMLCTLLTMWPALCAAEWIYSTALHCTATLTAKKEMKCGCGDLQGPAKQVHVPSSTTRCVNTPHLAGSAAHRTECVLCAHVCIIYQLRAPSTGCIGLVSCRLCWGWCASHGITYLWCILWQTQAFLSSTSKPAPDEQKVSLQLSVCCRMGMGIQR